MLTIFKNIIKKKFMKIFLFIIYNLITFSPFIFQERQYIDKKFINSYFFIIMKSDLFTLKSLFKSNSIEYEFFDKELIFRIRI